MNTLRPGPPRHRSIFAVDIEGSTTETNAAKAWLREAMYLLMERTLLASGIAEEHRDELVDRGDGILALIHPVDSVPKTLLLTAVVPTLDRLLHEYADLHPDRRLRLRAVLHAGEVHHDGRGCFGEALDVSFRLLDSPEVKRIFRRAPGHLLLVVSDHIFQTVIRHDYDGIDRQAFAPIGPVSVGGHPHAGWVRLATGDGEAERRRVPRLVRVARRLESHEHPA